MKKSNKFLIVFILIIAMTVMLISCTEKDAEGLIKLNTPTNIKLSGDSISWDTVPNAKMYTITMTGTDGNVEEYTASKSPYVIRIDKLGIYKVKVSAYGDGEKYGTSDFSEEIEYIKGVALDKPMVSVDQINGIASWEPIENASSYHYIIKNKQKAEVKQGDTASTSFNFFNDEDVKNKLFEKADAYSITVQARPNSDDKIYAASNYSEAEKYINHEKLDTPIITSISSSTLWWSSIQVKGTPYTPTYEVKLTFQDGEEKIYKASSDNCGISTFDLSKAGTYKIQVRAVGDEVYDNSDFSAINEDNIFIKLPEISSVQYTANGIESKLNFKVDSLENIGKFVVSFESLLADGSKAESTTLEVSKKPDTLSYDVELKDAFYKLENGILVTNKNDKSLYGRTYNVAVYAIKDEAVGKYQGNNIRQSNKVEADQTYTNYIAPNFVNGAYEIDSPAKFAFIKEKPDGSFKITADIDFRGYVVDSIANFTGLIDGDNHTLKNMIVRGKEDATELGLFGTLAEGGSISKLFIRDISFSYENAVDTLGSIAGINNGSITNIYVTGNQFAHKYNSKIKDEDRIVAKVAGGLVGINNGIISDCVANVEVEANTAAGLVAINKSGISYSYALGNVKAKEAKKDAVTNKIYAGGLVAINEKDVKEVSIINSFAVNKVEAKALKNETVPNAGGLIAVNGADCSILQSYAGNMYSRNATSIVEVIASGSNSVTGGFVANNAGIITNAYSTLKAIGSGSGKSGGFAGINTGTIENAYTTGGVGNNGKVGGFVQENTGTVTNAYYTKPNDSFIVTESEVGTLINEATDFATLAQKLGDNFGVLEDKPAPVLRNIVYVSEYKLITKQGSVNSHEAVLVNSAGEEVKIASDPADDTKFKYLCPPGEDRTPGNLIRAEYINGVSSRIQILVEIAW